MIVRAPLFGTEVEIVIDGDGHVAEAEEAYAFGLELQKRFNLYDPDSELSRLNRKRSMRVSKEFLAVLRLALAQCDDSYDIAKGREFLQMKRQETVVPVTCTYKDITIEGRTVRLTHDEVLIDLGSVAKGHIAARMAQRLAELGVESGYVNARGDLHIIGERVVHVQHPKEERILCSLKINGKAVATSGTYKQNHLHSSLLSATVIDDDLALADLKATLLMLGLHPDCTAMTVDTDMNITYHNGFERLLV